jgi:O-antigen/teichoic acid export membrane protein
MTIFGNEYVPIGSTVLIILSFGQLVNCLTGGVGYTLTMTGKQNIELGNSLALVVASVLLNLVLIPKYGALGAAFASSSSTLVINMLRVIEIHMLYRISPFSRVMLPILVPVMFSICIMPLLCFNINYMASLIVNSMFLLVVFAMSMMNTKMAEEDRHIITLLINKLHPICNRKNS